MKGPLVWTITILTVAGLAPPSAADPIEIAYIAADVPDAIPDADLWTYEYFVGDFDFDADQGFSVSFEPALFSSLQSVPPVNAGWDVLTVQPDLALGSPGLYDALALVPGASLADPFTVSFVWLGGPMQSPGSQFFTVNAFDASGFLTVIESGFTVPAAQPVPEPATVALVGAGLAAILGNSRRRRQSGYRR
jgi:PEP-CTERM motif